jgi:hypothetical protein
MRSPSVVRGLLRVVVIFDRVDTPVPFFTMLLGFQLSRVMERHALTVPSIGPPA